MAFPEPLRIDNLESFLPYRKEAERVGDGEDTVEVTRMTRSTRGGRDAAGREPTGSRFVLASASPRRIRLLKAIINDFEVIPGNIDESYRPGESPSRYAMRMSLEKSTSVRQRLVREGREGGGWFLGADTIVVVDDRVLGKPGGPGEARGMLEMLSARVHEVITGVCVVGPEGDVLANETVTSRVWMRRIGTGELDAYIETGEPLDKAGGYAIQGEAGRFVDRVEGSYTNVVGLPVERVRRLLMQAGLVREPSKGVSAAWHGGGNHG